MRKLPALSLSRPWPHLIFNHGKNVENRTWATKHRGDLLIQAALTWDGVRAIETSLDVWMRAEQSGSFVLSGDRDTHPTGIVGVINLAAVCTAARNGRTCNCGPWAFDGQCHWDIRDAKAFAQPIPHPGRQGIWQVDDRVWPDVAKQLEAVDRA